jgi:outer membrane protein assembly factor BamB
MKFSPALLLLGLCASALPLTADISSWRNDGNGKYPDATAPLEWDGKDLWSTPLPGESNACPILIGDKIFLTAEPAQLLCIDRKSGKVLWSKSNGYEDVLKITAEARNALKAAKDKADSVKDQVEPLKRDLYRLKRSARRDRDNAELKKKVKDLEAKISALEGKADPATASFKKPPTHSTNGYASYTPVSDGKHVFASFGLGLVVAYDLDGKRLWAKRLDNPDHNWGGASSPILAAGTLVVRFADWVGLDPATGEERWRCPTEINFNCPAIFEVEKQTYLYTARGQLIRAKDGKLLPSQNFVQPDKPWAYFNTPSVIDGHLYTAHGNEGSTGEARALRIPATVAELEKSGVKEVWMQKVNKNRYYSSPLVHEGIVYIISREYVLQALDAKSGAIHYEQKLRGMTGTAYPSLTLAGDVIFAGAEDGNAAFFKLGKTYKELSRPKATPFRATPLFVDNICYLHTHQALRAIQAK